MDFDFLTINKQFAAEYSKNNLRKKTAFDGFCLLDRQNAFSAATIKNTFLLQTNCNW